MSILEHVYSNWDVLKKARLAFGVLTILSFLTGFGVNEYINDKTETRLRDQLDRQKDINGSLSILTNPDLKEKTLNLVEDIKELLTLEYQESQAIRKRYEDKTKHLGPVYSDRDEPVLQEAWSEMTTAYDANSFNTKRLYDERYKADAALLREELIERLPDDITQRDDILQGARAYNRYHLSGNSVIIEDIALDLEKLAKLPPE